MTDFFNWLTGGSISSQLFIIVAAMIGISLPLVYLIAFFQGRDISFWPPTIGQKTSKAQLLKDKKLKSTNVDFIELVSWDINIFRQRLATATEFCMYSIYNADMLGEIQGELRTFLARGGKIRFIYPQPNGNALTMVSMRSVGADNDIEHVNKHIELCIDTLRNLNQYSIVSNAIQVRFVDFLHSMVIDVLDGHSPNGVIYVAFNGFGQIPIERPSLIIKRQENEELFEFFLQTFENTWASHECKPIKLV